MCEWRPHVVGFHLAAISSAMTQVGRVRGVGAVCEGGDVVWCGRVEGCGMVWCSVRGE